jgi:hypothetical protein
MTGTITVHNRAGHSKALNFERERERGVSQVYYIQALFISLSHATPSPQSVVTWWDNVVPVNLKKNGVPLRAL